MLNKFINMKKIKILFIIIICLNKHAVHSQENYDLDLTFGNNGIATYNFNVYETFVTGQTIQTDGKILVSGYFSQTFNGPTYEFVLRLNPNGTIDNLFGNNGYISFPTTLISPKVKTYLFSNGDFLVAELGGGIKKFNTSGILDTTFNINITLAFNPYDIVILNDDKFILTYNYWAGTQYIRFKIQRYNSNGVLDSTFVTNNSDYGVYAAGNSAKLVLQPDGKIIVVHHVNYWYVNGGVLDFTLFKLNQDGSLDTTTPSTPIIHNTPNFYVLQNDGKLLFQSIYYPSTYKIKRFNADLTEDTSYGTSGFSTGFPNMASPVARIMSNNKVLCVRTEYGNYQNQSFNYLQIHKLNSSGFYDNSFGISGIQILPTSLNDKYAINMDLVSNSLYISGHGYNIISSYNNNSVFIAKLNSSMTLNTSEYNSEKNNLFSPNPVSNLITFSKNIKSISIYSIDGKIINSKLENNCVDVSHLSNGVYVVQIIDENERVINEKLIKK